MLRVHGRAAFAFIFVTVLLDMLAVGIIVPVLPKLILVLEGGRAASAATAYGVFGTVWAAMQFVFSPLLGALSDRFGRRPVVVLSNVGLGLDYVLMAWAPTLGWFFVGRVISGVTSSSVPTALAYVTDVTPPERRAARFGLLGAAFGTGFVIGPAAGGLLGSLDLRLPFWIAAGLSLANAAYGTIVLPESLPLTARAAFDPRRANPFGALLALRRHSTVAGLAATGFLYRLAHDALPALFVLYGHYRYGWNERTLGLVLAGVGVSWVVVQAGLVGRIVARLGERRSLVTGLGCGALGFVVYALAPTGSWFLAGIPVLAFFGLTNPALQALLTRRVGPTEQGWLQGAQASLTGVAAMIAPVLFTQTFAWAVTRAPVLPGAPFLLAAAVLCGAAGVAWRATA